MIFNLTTIEGIEPLDDQYGVDHPKTAPDMLYDVLFGEHETIEGDRAKANSPPDERPPLQTYALLDAAKIMSLPQLLAASDLKHRCLFKGDAYDELMDVAPWLVQLEDGNSFTRKLFTRDPEEDVPWYLWDAEPGIYLRSRASLDDLWQHFRKFTRVTDEDGKWFYLRFWEPRWAARLLTDMAPADAERFLSIVFQVIIVRSSGKAEIIQL